MDIFFMCAYFQGFYADYVFIRKNPYNGCYMLSTTNILEVLSLNFRQTVNNAVHILGTRSVSDQKLNGVEDNARRYLPK